MTQAPFILPRSPYPYDALEPYLNADVLHEHHDKHFAQYVDNLNRLLAATPALQQWSLEQMTGHAGRLPGQIRTAVRNNAGGVYNHALYFRSLAPIPNSMPEGAILTALDRDFGSLAQFWDALRRAAMAQFGSGNLWLVADRGLRLRLLTLNFQNTPFPLMPLAVIDLWEHAWYLQYRSDKAAYVEAVLPLLNWENIGARYRALSELRA